MEEILDPARFTSEIAKIFDAVRDVTDGIAKERKFSLTAMLGTFPSFDDMRRIGEAVARAPAAAAGNALRELLPSHLRAALGPEDTQTKVLLEHVAAAACHPDLFGHPHTPERVSDALADFANERVTVQTVTFLRGVQPQVATQVCGCTIVPAPATDRHWYSQQVPWGIMIPMGFPHSLLLLEECLPSAALPEMAPVVERTSHALQALRLACTAEVLSIGTIQRGVVFSPQIFKKSGGSFGGGMTWWPAANYKHYKGAVVLTEGHVREAEYLKRFVADDVGWLTVPIRRLDMALNRREQKDTLVDLAVSSEALLLGSGEKEGTTHRLKIRGSRLIAPRAERVQMSQWIGDMYTLRSQIVHGDRKPDGRAKKMAEPVRFDQEVYKFAEFVRAGIRRCARLLEAGEEDPPTFLDRVLLDDADAVKVLEGSEVPQLSEARVEETQAIFGFSSPPTDAGSLGPSS